MGHVCLQYALLPLKESSKSSIADAACESFGEIKDYLHIHRDVEDELEGILQSAAASKQGNLVLVCGNVGDGKSHLISMLLQKNPSYRRCFQVHNDATESLSPTSTNIDALRELLSPYADSRLSACKSKTILAINLGTLNNFLVADEKKEFTRLEQFVQAKQILEIGRQKENAYDPGSVFQFVNFSDHNLFFLTSDGPASPIIESALEKVASLSSYGNPFCQAHGEYCSGCPAKCPIKLNYELLRDPQIRKKVSELLIQCIVKHHHIVSIRALYNFIFDLIVPVELDGLNPDEIMGWVQKSSSDAYLQALFINHLFEHPEISRTFEHLHHLDPALRRSLFLDDQIISLITREDPAGMLATLGAAPALSETLVEHARTVKNHDALVKTYVRLMFFASSDAKGGHFDDIAYAEFMRLLYCWHTGERAELKKLYKLIHRATMTWSGKAPEGEMLLEVGNQQLKYRLSEKVTIKPIQLPPEKSDDKIVRKFSCILPLQFRTDDDAPKELTLTVDCRLYEMACKVDAGYRANQADKSNFIAFTSFTNDVMETGGLGTHLRITETETGEFFVLELDEFGDFTFRGD